MEQITLDGITYKIGNILRYTDYEYMDKGDLCTLEEIELDNEDIFFKVINNKTLKKFTGLYYWRFEPHKRTNKGMY